MNIFAYCYTDPRLEPAPDPQIWAQPWLQAQGWHLAGCYLDRASLTQPQGETHPQWQQLLHDCQQQPPDAVLVRQLADLGDSLQAVGDRLTQLADLHIPLYSPDSLDPLPFPAPLHAAQTLQTSQRSRRIRQGHAQNRLQGSPPPGKAPYGYRRGKTGYVIDRTTAPVVKDFFEQFLLYGSLRGAVRHLAKRYGKKISASTGQRWLTSPVYRGDLAAADGQVLRDTHASILSRQEAAQIDRLLRRNRSVPKRSASAPRSLAGLVFCAQCQSSTTVTRVTTYRKQPEYLYLRPTRCPNQPKCSAIAYDEILQATIERICNDLPRAIQQATLPDLSQAKQGLQGAIAAKQALLDQLPPLLATGVLDQTTADLRTYTLRTEIAQLEARLSQLPPVDLLATAQTVSIPQFWLDLSEPERRFYFREFIQRIWLQREGHGWSLRLTFFIDAPSAAKRE
jgi:DNA invertase Pin-like site-specific DNA recombinase